MTPFHPALFDAIGLAVLHSLWQGASAALVLAVVLPVLRRAESRYVAGCIALAVFLAAFVSTFAHFAAPLAGEQAITVYQHYFSANATGLSTALRPRESNLEALPAGIALVWLGGVLLLQLRAVGGWLLVQRMRRRGLKNVSDSLQTRFDVLLQRLRISRPVSIFESTLVATPAVICHFRPMILLPASLALGLTPEQLEAVLLHELAHIRRHDYLINVIQTFIETLLFYHPATWWFSRVIRRERENCCDDVVISQNSDRLIYASALAFLAEANAVPTQFALAASGNDVAQRIRRVLEPSRQARSAPVAALTAVLTLVTLVAGLAGLQSKAQVTTPAVSPFTQWLNEDVVWIIAPAERDAFLKLQTDEEREQFIEQFWLRRDPTPNTIENEFKTEHYRRIQFANNRFGAGTLPGWKSDRGRIYIMFGPPNEIDSHPSTACSASQPSYEDWRYRFIEGFGIQDVRTNVLIRFSDTTCDGTYKQTSDPARLPADDSAPTVPAAPIRLAAQQPPRTALLTGTPDLRDTERQKRIDYADRHFSTSVRTGSRTSRGQTYIDWGRPNEIDSHPTGSCLTNQPPFEDWRYRFVEGVGANLVVRFTDSNCDGTYQELSEPDKAVAR